MKKKMSVIKFKFVNEFTFLKREYYIKNYYKKSYIGGTSNTFPDKNKILKLFNLLLFPPR